MSDPHPDETCWTLINEAADGIAASRDGFARRYAPVIEAYLGARWRGSRLAGEIDDAVQEVFVECIRPGGALEKLQRGAGQGFRAFLYGVVRNVALRVEKRDAVHARREKPGEGVLEAFQCDEKSLSRVFDETWAKTLVVEAARLQARNARAGGERARRRVELLRLRFNEDLPIRDIAKRWSEEPAKVHEDYRAARRDFKAALLEILRFHNPDSGIDLESEAERILALFG